MPLYSKLSSIPARVLHLVALSAVATLLAACYVPPAARPAATAAEMLLLRRFAPAGSVTGASEAGAVEAAPAPTPTPTPAPVVEALAVAVPSPAAVTGTMPVSLTIPALAWSVAVVPMGWEAVLVDGKPTTRWLVPEDAGGWAVNSASPGAPGNMVVLGQQALGQALFRPLALGDVEIGQEIEVRATDGQTYIYKVIEASAPIPAIGATAEEQALSGAYLASGEGSRLTLITGWPADVSTHRVFVVAEYVGPQP